VQRGEQEQQREGVRRHDQEREGAESEERGGVAGELVLGADAAAWQQALARDEPAGESEEREHDQRACRPVGGGVASRRHRARRAVGPGAEEPEQLEQDDHPGPEGKPAAEGSQCRRQRNAPPPAAGEQVDGGGEEGQQAGDQHQLDRPAADQARAEVQVARRPLRELEPFVERAEQILRRAPYLVELVDAQPLRHVVHGIGRVVVGGRQRQRARSVRQERRLLVERVGEREVGELPEDRVARRPPPDLRSYARGRGLDQRSGRVAGNVAVDLQPDPSRPADRVEVDHRGDVVAQRRVRGELGRAERAEGAAVGRHEQDRVVRAKRPAGEPWRRAVGAGQLDEHRRPRTRCRSPRARFRRCRGAP
jgi:hypothetical protein